MTAADDAIRCRARNRQGEQCRRARTPGTTVCASHGSKAPAVKAAAQRRLALAEAETVVRNETARRGPLTLGDVYRELLETAATVVTWRNLLTARMDDLGDRLTYVDRGGTERARADVHLFQKALDQATRTLELIARLDLDARAASLSQRQAETVAAVIRRALHAAEVTPEQEAAAVAALPGLLRSLTEDAL